MSPSDSRQKVDLIIIGGGLAGSAATVFATERGIKTAQVSSTLGQTSFASGVLDLFGIYPTNLQKKWDDPWAGIAALIEDGGKHPYAKVGLETIRKAWESFLHILERAGLHYCGRPNRNATLVTCAGTLKTTFQVPRTMWPGVLALEEQRAVLIVDFQGMKEFSGVQMIETLSAHWPGLLTRRVKSPVPCMGADLQNIMLAEEMGSPRVLRSLADAIGPYLGHAEMIGMPAVLGLRQPELVIADLERMLGVPVFEIPTMPPSVPGFRLKEALDREALQKGALILHGMRAVGIEAKECGDLQVTAETPQASVELEGKGVILATGRFLGGGLKASRSGIRESLLDLPVRQPEKREDWHLPNFLDLQGHPVNRVGVEVDGSMRPLGRDGRIVYENVFAAGSLLADQDWVRTKCGAGLSIATAFAAVESFLKHS